MTSDTISEANFLLTELRYTLGQLHVQLLDLDEKTRESVMNNGKTINLILREMVESETEYQGRLRQLLHDPSRGIVTAEHVPLPVGEGEEQPGAAALFEHRRGGTISLLEKVGADWPADLLNLTRDQVQHDRHMTTEIAECRQSMFTGKEEPELDEPLTEHPRPHQFAESP